MATFEPHWFYVPPQAEGAVRQQMGNKSPTCQKMASIFVSAFKSVYETSFGSGTLKCLLGNQPCLNVWRIMA